METFLYAKSEDQPLPVPIRPEREVSWLHGIDSRRLGWLGRKPMMLCIESGFPERTTVKTEAISEIRDPNLRYALRFADAANAAGSIRDGEFSSHSLEVRIVATDEGTESRLLDAWYSGIDDTFMDDLRKFAPYK